VPIPLKLRVAKSKLHEDLNKKGKEKKKANATKILRVEATHVVCVPGVIRFDSSIVHQSISSRLDHTCDDEWAIPL